MKGRNISIAIGIASILIAAAVLATSTPAAQPSTSTNHYPADKIGVSGSSIEFRSVPITEGSSSTPITLFKSTLMRTSSPTDLIFSLTLECALWTQVTTVGNGESEATATLKAWIELDGKVVPVSGDDKNEPGKVVFCDRTHRQTVVDLNDDDANITQYLRTRTANAFQWITLNVGSGIHTITAKAEITAQVTNLGMAQGGVGKRTLVVDPVKLANDATI